MSLPPHFTCPPPPTATTPSLLECDYLFRQLCLGFEIPTTRWLALLAKGEVNEELGIT